MTLSGMLFLWKITTLSPLISNEHWTSKLEAKSYPCGIYHVTFFLCGSRGLTLQPRLWDEYYTDKTLCTGIGCCVCIKDSVDYHWHFTPEKLIVFVWHDCLIIHSCFCTIAYTFKRNLILRERESSEVYNWGFIPQRKDEFDPKPNETGVESHGITNPG